MSRLRKLVPLESSPKIEAIILSLSAAVLACVSVAHIVAGISADRPWFLFAGVGTSLTLLLIVVYIPGSINRRTLTGITTVGLLNALFLRLSGFYIVAISGIDHGRWVMRVQRQIQAGGIIGNDMYASAPFYLLELGISQLILGLDPFQTRFVTILIATLLPVAIGLFTYRITENCCVSLTAFLLAVPHMLFLRTSALLEAESMAILWSVITLYVLVKYIQTDDRRFYGLFVAFAVLAVFLHFLYATVIFGIAVGTQVLLYVSRKTPGLGSPLERHHVRRLSVANLVAGVFIPLWILLSTYGGVARDTLRSGFDRSRESSGTEPTNTKSTPSSEKPTPSSETTSSSSDSLFDLVDVFIPSSSTVGRSIGAGTWSTLFDLLGAFTPLLALLGLGGVGGVITLRRRRGFDIVLLSGGITIATAAIVGVTVRLKFDLGFRLYYFLAVFLVMFAAIGIAQLMRFDGRAKRALRVSVVLLFVSYAVLGPMSPLGNNVDPRFGGTPWHITQTEQDQLQSFGVILNDGAVVGSDVPQIPRHLRLQSNNDDLYLTRDPCHLDDQVMSGGELTVCQRSSPATG